MQKSLIIGLLSALILVIFALKNSTSVQLDFIIGKPVQGSLSLILLVTIIIGIFVGLLLSYPTVKKLKDTISDNKTEIAKLSGVLEEYKKEYGTKKIQEEEKGNKSTEES
jgi:uncharacterized integral membrane protein